MRGLNFGLAFSFLDLVGAPLHFEARHIVRDRCADSRDYLFLSFKTKVLSVWP